MFLKDIECLGSSTDPTEGCSTNKATTCVDEFLNCLWCGLKAILHYWMPLRSQQDPWNTWAGKGQRIVVTLPV